MCIVRTFHDKDHPFAMINKESLNDKNLSLEASGLWARLLSRPDDWSVSVSELKKSWGIGEQKIYRILNELIDNGYALRVQTRNNGRYAGTEIHIFEAKIGKDQMKLYEMGSPYLEKPDAVKPDAVFQGTTNTDLTKKDLERYEREKERKKKKRNQEILTDPVCADAQTPSLFSKKGEEKKKPSKEALELAKDFFDKLLENDETLIAPNFEKWALELDRINQVDKQSFDDIERLIGFVTTNKFWKKAISSPSGLRKKWNSIALQAPESHVDGRPTMRMKRRWAKSVQESLPDRSKMTIDEEGVIFYFENQEPERLLFSDERFDKEIVDIGAKLRNHQYSVLVARRLAVNA